MFASQEKSSRMHKLNASVRLATLAFSFILFAVATALFFDWLVVIDWNNIGYNSYAIRQQYTWINSIGVSWHVGLDGLSFPMVWLTAFLIPVTILMTWDEKSWSNLSSTLVTYGRCFDWRICRIRLVYVLRILGINAYSNVLLDSQLGRKRTSICGTEVLHLHIYRQCHHASWPHYAVLSPTRRFWRGLW